MELAPDEARALIEDFGSISRAAWYLGVAESTLRGRIKNKRFIRVSPAVGKAMELQKEVDRLKTKISLKPNFKPHIIPGRDSNATRIIAIGDTHDQPGMSKDRFKWIAKHCLTYRPDRIIHIGDFASWDSVSTHEQKGSVGHAMRPSFQNDLESCEEAMNVFYKALGDYHAPLELVCGNHEDRIKRFENATPETVGTLWTQFEDLAARYRWRLHQYGRWLIIDGVGFIHVPMNIMGRPYGGQQSENQIANHATNSIVFGHTHRSSYRKVPKIGVNNSIEVLNLGSAMPDNYVAKYAGTATSGWSYGIYELTIRGGHITSHNHINMQQLEDRYS